MKVKNARDWAVTVAPANAEPFEVEAGATVEVDDKLGKSLLQQEENWSPVGSTAKKETK